jgi:hypothetical protein
VASSQVLDERVTTDHGCRGAIGSQTAHRPQPGLESTVVALDGTVALIDRLRDRASLSTPRIRSRRPARRTRPRVEGVGGARRLRARSGLWVPKAQSWALTGAFAVRSWWPRRTRAAHQELNRCASNHHSSRSEALVHPAIARGPRATRSTCSSRRRRPTRANGSRARSSVV